MSLREKFERRQRREVMLKSVILDDLQLVAGVVVLFIVGFVLGLGGK